MYFLVDTDNKIIFGWSAKCGCSHIKKLFHFLKNTHSIGLHDISTYGRLPIKHEEFKIILIIRNPYDRIVSGFLEKYHHKHGNFIRKWKHQPLTFSNFLNELDTHSTNRLIEKHHFCPQLSEEWKDSITPHKIYDIKSIDYKYIQSLYNTQIPQDILNFRGGHENKNTEICTLDKIYDLEQHIYINTKPTTSQFFNENLTNIINKFYKKDFDFFTKHNFYYSLT